MRKLRTIAGIAVAVLLLGGVAAAAATTYGTESDPLVTLSYLNDVLKPELEQKYDRQTKDTLAAVEAKAEAVQSGAYQSVTVKAGQTMTCSAGCDFLVRSGSAYVSAGVLNVTAGTACAKNDWLLAHNLYLAPEAGMTVTATGDTLLMVRGGYEIG